MIYHKSNVMNQKNAFIVKVLLFAKMGSLKEFNFINAIAVANNF